MPVINSLFLLYTRGRLRKIGQYAKHTFEIQEKQFKTLIHAARKTKFGLHHNFKRISSIAEFQDSVPLRHYEEIKPYIDSVRKGEQNVLWPSSIKWFAKSSGTTDNKSKFIPVSNESLKHCHYQGGIDTLALFLNSYPQSRIFTGKALTLGGSHQIDQYNTKMKSGDLSAIMIRNIPLWADLIRTPPAKIALIGEWEKKLEAIIKTTRHQNITSLAGVPSWNLVMIKHLLQFSGKRNLLEVWPNLELFIHGGINFSPYREQYYKVIPSAAMKYVETYNASEGFFAIQNNPDDLGMLLMLDYGVFYEFVPMDSFFSENPKALHIGEVKTDTNYALVISTNAGLWRYIIGDTIMFTSLYPHKIVLTGRTRHFINAFGEELIIDNADKALKSACDSTGASIFEYTAAPVYMNDIGNGRHEWLIEFETDPDNIDRFILVLDETLKSINSDYEAKRYKDITLGAPLVRSLPKGSFYKWLQVKGKLGGQNKVPRLSNNRKYVEEILAITGQQ
jgi:hypothetical protein